MTIIAAKETVQMEPNLHLNKTIIAMPFLTCVVLLEKSGLSEQLKDGGVFHLLSYLEKELQIQSQVAIAGVTRPV